MLQTMRNWAGILLVSLPLSACASAGGVADVNDPFEGPNRAIFSFNQRFDRAVAKPVAEAYLSVVPQPARSGIHNLLSNFFLPVTLLNDLLQADISRGVHSATRFVINSTIGIAGIVDVANRWGIHPHTEDFGQTLAVWGLGDGPYLVLPVLGPSGLRDATGDVADIFLDPFTYLGVREKAWWTAGIITTDAIDFRSRNIDLLDQIEKGALDPYAAVRSLYRQNRKNEIRNGNPVLEDLPDF